MTRVPGWESVTNALAALEGADSETNSAYRRRLQLTPHRLRRGPLRALEAALLDAGASRAVAIENNTDAAVTVQGLSIAAHGVMCIVQGGTDANIAEAVLSKTIGASLSGAETVGDAQFQRVTLTRVLLTITTSLGTNFPSSGVADIKTEVAVYASSAFEIGEAIVPARLYTPANAVPGHSITALEVTDSSSNALPDYAYAQRVVYSGGGGHHRYGELTRR